MTDPRPAGGVRPDAHLSLSRAGSRVRTLAGGFGGDRDGVRGCLRIPYRSSTKLKRGYMWLRPINMAGAVRVASITSAGDCAGEGGVQRRGYGCNYSFTGRANPKHQKTVLVFLIYIFRVIKMQISSKVVPPR